MTETQEVVFDEKTGISAEEQKEILAKIDGIAEKNRLSLSKGASGHTEKQTVKAKKSGALFPLAVNIAAAVILFGGGLFLVSFNGKKDAQVREGTAVYNLTERAVLDEIRKDTAQRLASKEQEIESINSRLEEVDAQLSELYSSNQGLTAEQLAAQERLISMQSSFRSDLSALQNERSQILEDSRSREARLRAQLEERNREFAAAQQKASSELDSAMAELDLLSKEQERAAAIDAQLSGSFQAISVLIQNGQFEQAAQAVENLRLFFNSAALAARAFQPRREFYNQAINSIEIAVNEMRRSGGSGGEKEQWELQAANTRLEETIAGMQKTIDAFSAGSSGQANRLSELEASVSTLRAANAALETAAAEKDRNISSLQTERGNLNQTVSDLKTVNSEQEQEILNLRSQLSIIRQALQE
jgi:chromosome segregation ATPase